MNTYSNIKSNNDMHMHLFVIWVILTCWNIAVFKYVGLLGLADRLVPCHSWVVIGWRFGALPWWIAVIDWHIGAWHTDHMAYWLAYWPCSLQQHFLKSRFLCTMTHRRVTCHIPLLHRDPPVSHQEVILLWNFINVQRDDTTWNQNQQEFFLSIDF